MMMAMIVMYFPTVYRYLSPDANNTFQRIRLALNDIASEGARELSKVLEKNDALPMVGNAGVPVLLDWSWPRDNPWWSCTNRGKGQTNARI